MRKTPNPLLPLALTLLLATVAALPAAAATCQPPIPVAQRLLDDGAGRGALRLTAEYFLDESRLDADAGLPALVEARLPEPAIEALRGLGSATLCASLVLDVDGELVVADQRRLELGDLRGATGWRYGADVALPEGASMVVVIVEAPELSLYGAAVAEAADDPLAPPGPGAVRLTGNAWHELLRPATSEAAPDVAPTVVRLVPPRQQPATGNTRFDALVSTDLVDRVVFKLDGREVASEGRAPFVARLDLTSPARPQTVEAIAYDSTGRELGRDTLEVNRVDTPFRVRITEMRPDPAGNAVELAATVTVPPESRLDRVELYRNEELLRRFDGSFRTRVETPGASADDYLRVAAFLADGSSIDDVVLLNAPGGVEKVEVNLVELRVVAVGADGKPVKDLKPEDFLIHHRGQARPPQSLAYADDVPLVLGVVIDTSGSMELVMADTRKAAAKFLGTTVLPQDRAFLVDFDKQPRLLHPITADLPNLLLDLARLRAAGATAMYDAIVFSMLQFEREPGRKALVVLTDGDDYDSRFGPKYCVELGTQTGVPIYIIGLGGLDTLRRTYSKRDLSKTTDETGGRLYFVDSLGELDAAYAQINAELRSQYTLTFYSDRDLDAKERQELRVEIKRPGVTARTVFGGQRSSP